ncbi:hypothetical protein B4096_2450 [Heyndrickxia coagulans]|nr:hypothetical protein B4096_2450 [Heyndrickxia coagulans]
MGAPFFDTSVYEFPSLCPQELHEFYEPNKGALGTAPLSKTVTGPYRSRPGH